MPFIKRYPDGSVFDYTHGHRTAEQVAREQSEGTYKEPAPFSVQDADSKKLLGSFALLGGVLLLGGLAWSMASSIAQEGHNREVLIKELESRTRGEVLDTKDKDSILLRVGNDHALGEGESVEEHTLHTVIVPCEVYQFAENDKGFAVVNCEGFDGSLTVELPFK